MRTVTEATTCYLRPDQIEGLQLLKDFTRVPTAARIREGIDLVLEANETEPKVQCQGCEHCFDAEDIRDDGFCGMCAPLTPEENEQARQESNWEIDNDR